MEQVPCEEASCTESVHGWVLQSVLLGAAVVLVNYAVKAIVFVNVVPFVCNLGGDGLGGCADGEWLCGVVRLWCGLCGAIRWLWEGQGVCGLVQIGWWG